MERAQEISVDQTLLPVGSYTWRYMGQAELNPELQNVLSIKQFLMGSSEYVSILQEKKLC